VDLYCQVDLDNVASPITAAHDSSMGVQSFSFPISDECTLLGFAHSEEWFQFQKEGMVHDSPHRVNALWVGLFYLVSLSEGFIFLCR